MRLPADQRRIQLLDVARARFAEQGFHATSMDEIAESAGVTKPVLYQHFPSKRALYVELLDSTGQALLTTLAESAGRAPSGRSAVEAGFRAYFQFAMTNRDGFRLLLASAVRSDDEFSRVVSEMMEAITNAIAQLIDIPDEQHRMVLASAIVGMAESVSRYTLWGRSTNADPNTLARWISELAWFGLRGVRVDASGAGAL
jgi:AcrR family transcriptional regulator